MRGGQILGCLGQTKHERNLKESMSTIDDELIVQNFGSDEGVLLSSRIKLLFRLNPRHQSQSSFAMLASGLHLQRNQEIQ